MTNTTQTKKFRRNERVAFDNPNYVDFGIETLSTKICLGHIKDIDGNYVIIQRDSDKGEFYVHNSKVYKKATKKELIKKRIDTSTSCSYLNIKALKQVISKTK